MKKREHRHGDFELNLAPIIDCFTVLVTFMLASSSFLSIGFLDAGLNANQAIASTEVEPQVTVELRLLSPEEVQIELSGKVQSKRKVAIKDYIQELKVIQGNHTDVKAITLSAEPEIPYERVVATMDQLRPVFGQVLLGGF